METATISASTIGTPYKSGVSGCPIGGNRLLKARTTELHTRILPDFPSLSATDDALLWQACGLLAKAQSPRIDAELAVRLTGTAHRVLTALQRRYKSMPAAPVQTESYIELSRRAQIEYGAKRAAELAADAEQSEEMPEQSDSRSGADEGAP